MKLKMLTAQTIILLFAVGSLADNCAEGSYQKGGNWYCAAVKAIEYHNVGVPGSYRRVTAMAPDGSCSSEPKDFSGPLAPLDEELSLHFRGPLHLKQFAAYRLGGSRKRHARGAHLRRHAHQHIHNRRVDLELTKSVSEAEQATIEKRQMITATIDGVVQSWMNNYFGPNNAPAPTPSYISSQPAAVDTKPPPASNESPSPSTPDSTPGQYLRVGYYDAATQQLDALTFLGNHGGSGSGVVDNEYGASLSYLSRDGTSGASSPEVLTDALLSSNVEVIIMTDRICNGDCGFVRPGSVAYHGFEGADKVFLMEFSMPHEGDVGFNGDMPAIWALNAQVPRTIQYGHLSCSCWESGCGEFDIVEVLSPGAKECKSTIHTNAPMGDSDYIERPTSSFMKLAVIFSSANSKITIQVLDDDVIFGPSLSSEQIDEFINSIPRSLISEFSA